MMEAVKNSRLSLRVLFVLAATMVVALTALLGFTEPAKADLATSYPLHMTEGFKCTTDGAVSAKPPGVFAPYYGGLETVWWKADLYRWNGSGWAHVSTMDWHQAATSQYGLRPYNGLTGGEIWMNSRSRNMLRNDQWIRWGGLSRGHYTIMNRYYWQASGVHHSEQGFYGTTGYSYCTI